jgi:hypothetical protein
VSPGKVVESLEHAALQVLSLKQCPFLKRYAILDGQVGQKIATIERDRLLEMRDAFLTTLEFFVGMAAKCVKVGDELTYIKLVVTERVELH